MSALATLQEHTHVDQAVLFFRALQDDTEEAPWMSMGDRQFWSASGFAHSLRNYATRRHLHWYVAAMLPIRFAWPDVEEKKQLAPDVFVAFTDQAIRSSFDAETEGGFPPFVVEVVSPSSESRDAIDKVKAYDLLHVQEYVIFRPEPGSHAILSGYRRAPSGAFVPWEPEAEDHLWSDLLRLSLVAEDRRLQAYSPDGQPLLLPDQSEALRIEAEERRERAEAERAQEAVLRAAAEAARSREATLRAEAEAEVRRLRDELDRRRQRDEQR